MSRLIVSILLATLLSGPVFAAPYDTQNLRMRIDTLEREVRSLRPGGAGGSIPGSAVGNISARIDGLEEQIRVLRGQVEESQYKIDQTEKQLKALTDDMNMRVGQLEQMQMNATATPAMGAPEVVAGQQPATETPAVEDGKTVATDDKRMEMSVTNPPAEEATEMPEFGSSREHYNYGFSLMNKAQYGDAGKVFESFLQKYPKDPLTSNVYYWLGETFYVREDYMKAADSFRQGFEAQPNGIKAPDNLFKLAKSLNQLGKREKSCIVLKQILIKFKGGAESVLQKARDERQQLNCPE